jgi:hypothetical protein
MKTKIYTFLVTGIMFLAVPLSHAQNILTDGDFSTTTSIGSYFIGYPPANVWCTWQGGSANATATVVDGVCNYQIISPADLTYEIQLVQAGFPLEQGHSYRLSFDVKADANRTFGVFLGEDEGNWTDLLGYDRYSQNATTDWQTITLDFNASCVFAYHKLSFELGTININMYFDNVSLIDLGPYTPSVGILGTSVNGGWDVDVDMLTTDGVNYTLSNYPLTVGHAKFRQDNVWCANWGNNTFPSGTGYQDGPDIPLSNAGSYDISFNKQTGEYSFACVSNCSAYIGIIGSAVPPSFGLEPDVNMSTDDGIIYTLKSYTLIDGGLKFRQNDSWDISWGNTTFPTGKAVAGAADIPVTAGMYDVTFNTQTLEYSFTAPSIGILGSALNGWDNDIDLQTTDGINYTLGEYSFIDGAVKFRTDNSWDVNWGGYSFPAGWAYLYGPDIQVQAGTYKVAFNMVTGEYSFTATTCPIAGIQCPYDQYWSSSPGVCGTNVYYQPVTAAANCGGDGISVVQTAGLPSGSLFPVGSTTNTFILTNASGNTATCSFNVMVFDWEPPLITDVDAHIAPIWPPNHKMICIKIDYNSSDNCGIANCELSVSSNEPVNDVHGNCVKQPDWVILDNHHVLLKADREGPGNGREYTITITCTDGSYNTSMQQVIVKIPHDRKGPHDKKDFASESCTIEIVNQANGTSFTKSENVNASVGNANFNEELPFNVNIYPNPARDVLNVEIGNSNSTKVNILVADAYGRTVINKVVEQSDSGGINQIQLSTSDLSAGVYILKLTNGSETTTTRFVKQK